MKSDREGRGSKALSVSRDEDPKSRQLFDLDLEWTGLDGRDEVMYNSGY